MIKTHWPYTNQSIPFSLKKNTTFKFKQTIIKLPKLVTKKTIKNVHKCKYTRFYLNKKTKKKCTLHTFFLIFPRKREKKTTK